MVDDCIAGPANEDVSQYACICSESDKAVLIRISTKAYLYQVSVCHRSRGCNGAVSPCKAGDVVMVAVTVRILSIGD